MKALKRKLDKQLKTGRRHLTVTVWLLADLARLLRWRLVSVGLFGLLAIGCKFLAAWVLYLFVDALSMPEESLAIVPILNIEVDLHQFFVIGVVAGTFLMMVATATQFTIRRAAVVAAALFEERCVRRVLAAASQVPHPSIQMNGEMVKRGDLRVILAGVRSCNMIARQAVQLMPSLIGLVSAMALLIVIDPKLTATLILALLGVLVLQYPMTNRSVRASDASEIDRRAAMNDMQGFVSRLEGVSTDIDHDHGSLDRLFGRGSAFQRDLKTFTRRIDGMILGDLMARLGNHAVLAGLFVFIGSQILSGARDWASFAAYLAIARMSMKDFQTTGKIFGQIGRLFMPVERYMHFIKAVMAKPPSPKPANDLALRLRDAQGQPLTLSLEPHHCYGILANRVANGEFSEIFTASTGRIPPALVDDSLLDPLASLRINLGLEDNVVETELADFVDACGPADAPIILESGWLDRPAQSSPSDEPWFIATLKVAAANIHGRPGVAIDASFLKHLPNTWLTNCARHLQSGPVIVFSTLAKHLPELPETKVVLANEGRLAWWLERIDAELKLRAINEAVRSRKASNKDDDDALMMM